MDSACFVEIYNIIGNVAEAINAYGGSEAGLLLVVILQVLFAWKSLLRVLGNKL